MLLVQEECFVITNSYNNKFISRNLGSTENIELATRFKTYEEANSYVKNDRNLRAKYIEQIKFIQPLHVYFIIGNN